MLLLTASPRNVQRGRSLRKALTESRVSRNSRLAAFLCEIGSALKLNGPACPCLNPIVDSNTKAVFSDVCTSKLSKTKAAQPRRRVMFLPPETPERVMTTSSWPRYGSNRLVKPNQQAWIADRSPECWFFWIFQFQVYCYVYHQNRNDWCNLR